MASTLELLNAANVQFLTNPPLLIASQTGAQTISNATITALTWPSPTVDTYTAWSAGNPTRITPKYPGYYSITGSVAFAVNGSGARSVAIRKNGVATDLFQTTAAASGFNQVNQVTGILLFNGSTDYVEIYVDQVSGGNLNTVVTLTSVTALWVHA